MPVAMPTRVWNTMRVTTVLSFSSTVGEMCSSPEFRLLEPFTSGVWGKTSRETTQAAGNSRKMASTVLSTAALITNIIRE